MDAIDRRIVTALQRDGRMTNQDLADAVNLSPSPCLRRIRNLEAKGIVQGYSADVDAAVEYGAVERVRPKMMTVTAIIAGLLPILWSHGAGADVMKRIAAPMVGGMVSSTVLTLLVIPAVYSLWREWEITRG
mgnify:CR=1 FL=1